MSEKKDVTPVKDSQSQSPSQPKDSPSPAAANMQLVPAVDSQMVVRKLLPDTEVQDIYLMASLSRNIIVSQCMYFLSLFDALSKSLQAQGIVVLFPEGRPRNR